MYSPDNDTNQKKSENVANQGRDLKGKFTPTALSPAVPPTAADLVAGARIAAFMETGKAEVKARYDLALQQAQDSTTSSETLDKIVKQYFIFNQAQWTLECVAANPNASPEALAKLATHNWSSIRTAVAANPNTLPETFSVLIEPPADHSKEYYLKISNTSFGDEDEGERNDAINMYYATLQEVARNSRVPKDTLYGLHYIVRHTGGVDVDRCLALNQNSPLKLLSELGNGGIAYVREGVASNPNTHEGLLMDLAEDGDAGVRKAVIANPNASEKTKEIARNYKSLFGYNLDTN